MTGCGPEGFDESAEENGPGCCIASDAVRLGEEQQEEKGVGWASGHVPYRRMLLSSSPKEFLARQT